MKILLKKVFVSFSVLSVVLWGSGALALADESIEGTDKLAKEKITICHTTDEGFVELEVATEAVAAHLEHGDTSGNCPEKPPVIPVVVHGEWCSALIGVMGSDTLRTNNVVNVNDDDAILDLTDVGIASEWYGNGSNTACRESFGPEGEFTQANYEEIDWCAGLLQGLRDSNGTQRGQANFSEIFDISNDGVIDLSDIAMVATLVANGDQNACYVHYGFPDWPEEPSNEVTIMAQKVVCDNESDLPNWGAGGLMSMIDANTAANYVAEHSANCHLESDWSFQYGFDVSDPGKDFYGPASAGWQNFDTTTGDGTMATAVISFDEPVKTASVIKVREVLKNKYIPFSYTGDTAGAPGSDVSAEFYCYNDVLNYDNFDYVNSPVTGNTYYCVAFNALEEEPIDDPVVPGPWCSVLKGLFPSVLNTSNPVGDVYGDDGVVDLSDVVVMSQWYGSNGNNDTCYAQFSPESGAFNFNSENYTNIDWCQGFLQGLTDSYGSQSGEPRYSSLFDLNDDAAVNLTDLVMATATINANDQSVCYQYFVPPFPDWQPVDPINYCGDGNVAGTEECDGDEPVACTTAAGYTGTKSCNMMPSSDSLSIQTVEPIYCVWNPCVTDQVCGDGIINGSEQCDDGVQGSATCTAQCTTQSSGGNGGGGGGRGVSPFNIFNVQSSVLVNSATITWQTNRDSLTWMMYGTSTSYGSEYQGANYHSTHTLDLSSLLPGTLYHYQIRAKDIGGNTAYDIDRTFTTPGGLPPQVLGVKEEACKVDVDGDIKGVMQFIAGSLIRACGPEVYHVLGNDVYHIPNWQYLHDNYFAQRIFNVSPEVIEQYGRTMTDDKSVKGKSGKVAGAKLYADGTLLKAKNGKIYVIVNGKKVHVVSLEELKKYAGSKMYNVSDSVLNQY